MLNKSFEGKSILIVGPQTVVGRVFLKKMISLIGKEAQIYALQIGKDKSRRQKFLEDPYFSTFQKKYLVERIKYISLQEISFLPNSKLNYLINFFVPMDFTQQDKIIDYHILKTREITTTLSKIHIQHCIHLSSIYFHEPGYVPQNQERPSSSFNTNFTDRAAIQIFLRDNFTGDKQVWQWTIRFMEQSYSSIAHKTDIVRLPSLGPTLGNNQGYAIKFNYFTYLIYQIGTGRIENINGLKEKVIDVVPADFAANFVIILAANVSNSTNLTNANEPTYSTHNLSTSTRNPIKLQQFVAYSLQAWNQYQNKRISVRINDRKWQRALLQAKDNIPKQIKQRLGNLLDIPSWRIESQKDSIQLEQKRKFIKKYQYFLDHEWICQSNNTIDLFNQISSEQQNNFNFNVNSINWRLYAKLCCYSIKKFMLHHHVQEFKSEKMDLLSRKTSSYFSDIVWAFTEGKDIKTQNWVDIKSYVMASKSVKEAIKNLVEERMMKLENSPTSYQKAEEQFSKIAQQMCTQMFSQYSMKSIRGFAWFLHKVFRTIYQKVVIDKNSMARIKAHNEKQQGPLIVVPTHRSYIDFLIMSYVFFSNGIKCPHIAAAQDFLNMAVIHILLRKSGAFFIKRNQKKYRELYKAVMTEYISKLLGQSSYLQFFIEGTRSRVGKMLSPKFGILSIIAKNVLDGKIPDAQILPVTINYEKVLEGNSFTYEMMGQAKIKQSLSRLIKAVDVLKQNYGRIYIQICEPISVKNYFADSKVNYETTLNNLGEKIVFDLTDNLLVTSPAILASIVLMHRKGISDDSLSEKVSWLCREISSRNIKIARSQADSSISITNTLGLLADVITKSKKDMFQVQVSFDQNSFIKLFNMTYYRNTLTHIFFEEALVIVALGSFGFEKITTPTVSTNVLFEAVYFLANLLSNQFFLRHTLTNRQRFNDIIQFLTKKEVLKLQNDFVVVTAINGNHFNFACSLIWPLIESYWITCLYLFKLSKNTIPMPMAKFLSQIQWFAQSLISQRIISHVEAISIDTIKNAVTVFTKMKILKNVVQEYNGESVASVKVSVPEKEIKLVEEKIQIFLKSSYAKSVKGILQSGQGSVNLDFPFLSKL